jgi:hypothetical protein
MINKEIFFVPYEQSLQLKQLGFCKSSFGAYNEDGKLTIALFDTIYPDSEECLAPTYNQAIEFFKEKYNINKETLKKVDIKCLKELIEIVNDK